MKKFKFAKIFVLVLSVALLIGSAIGVATSANETESYEIEAINVIYKDQIFVAIAVDAPVEEAANIEVGYTFNGTSYTADYHSNMAVWEKNGDDTLYPVFVTVGIPAKDQGEDIIAEAHVKGGAAGNAKNVSVASYLYQRLYKDGVIAATDEDGLAYREFYLSTLRYIAKAQTVLYNNENPDLAPRTLVTDYVAVMMEDATADGASFVFSKETNEITPVYTGSYTRYAWNVTTYDEWGVATTTEVKDSTITLTQSALITPVVLTFEIGTPSIVETFEGDYTNKIVTLADGSTTDCPIFGDYLETFYSTAMTNTNGEAVAKVIEYTTASGEVNKAFNMYSPGRINTDGTRNTNNSSHYVQIKVMESVVPEGEENALAVEFDLKLGLTIPEDSCAVSVTKSPVQFLIANQNQNGYKGYAYAQYNPALDLTTGILSVKDVEIGDVREFLTVKFVFDIDDKLMHVYANNVFKGSVTAPHGKSGDNFWEVFATYGPQWFQIGTYNDGGMVDCYLDNVKAYRTYCID